MTALTTRDALAKAYDPQAFEDHPVERNSSIGHVAAIQWAARRKLACDAADRAVTSGVVIDAATLADDEAAFDAVVAKMRSQVGSTRADRVREVFDALAAALTERAQ